MIIRRDGSKINVSIGEQPDEPKFVVTDLLPHLAQEQMKRTLADGVRGEELNILIGSRPFRSDEGSELVKLNIMKLLHENTALWRAISSARSLSSCPPSRCATSALTAA